MPHAHNAGWMSLMLGRPVVPPRREVVQDVVDSRTFFNRSHLNVDLPDLAELQEGVELRDGLTAEIYVPHGEGPFPPLVYLHGGAWCAGSPKGARRVAMRLAAAGHTVVNVDYALAPERLYPAAVSDAVYAARWTAARFGGPIAIGGESAGANLAAAALAFLVGGAEGDLDEGDLAGQEVAFSAALLVYGLFDFPLLVTEPGSNVGSVEVAFNEAYLGPHYLGRHRDPLVSPVFAPDLAAFPPTYLTCGDEDSLLGQTLSMTKALAAANVPTTLSVVPGCDHAFVYLDDVLPAAGPELERIERWLAERTRHTLAA
jgi:acetyl esterase